MIRHDYDADKTQKTEKRIERKHKKEAYSSCPSFALRVSREQIKTLCEELNSLPKESNAVIINLLKGNDFQPVTLKMIEDKFAKHALHVDHDYLPGKHKKHESQMEAEASECELNDFFKRAPIDYFGGNECEPLDFNFSYDLVISHSVIVSDLPGFESDTGITEETETDFAMISEQTLNGNADFQNM